MTLSLRHRNLANWILTQILWLICVQGGNVKALIAGLCYWIIYVIYIGDVKSEWRSIAIIVSSGFIIDMLLSLSGLITFSSNMALPLWLLVLWSGFATLFHHGLEWLANKSVLAAALGAIGGPLAYIAGANLSMSQIQVSLPLFFFVYAILWSLYIPVFLFISGSISKPKTLPGTMRS